MSAGALRGRLGLRPVFPGWSMTWALSFTTMVAYGVLFYIFSVAMTPMQDDLGWSAATLTGAYSVALLVSGIVASWVGRWIDVRGGRWVMTAGAAIGSVCVLGWSRVDTVWLYYLVWVGIGLAMATTFYEPAFAALTAWFDRYRARSLLIVTIVGGFASTVFLPLGGWMDVRMGWRGMLSAMALIMAVTTIPLSAIFIRDRPEQYGAWVDNVRPDPANAKPAHERSHLPSHRRGTGFGMLRDRAFRWLTLSFFLETFSTIAAGVFLIPYLTWRGESPEFAAAATGLIGAAQVLSRVVATAIGERISATTLTMAIFGLQGAAILLLMGWRTHLGVILAVAILGMGRGAVTLMRAQLVVDYFGREGFGAISGTMSFFLTGARSLAPIVVGSLFTLAGSYDPVLWTTMTVSLLAAVALFQLERESRGSVVPE
ncbi:MAG: MFS transporter [Thermomicrobiales bacterium]